MNVSAENHEPMNRFLPPPVTPSGEEPIAAGGWQFLMERKPILFMK
jgi:hypothetical protein